MCHHPWMSSLRLSSSSHACCPLSCPIAVVPPSHSTSSGSWQRSVVFASISQLLSMGLCWCFVPRHRRQSLELTPKNITYKNKQEQRMKLTYGSRDDVGLFVPVIVVCSHHCARSKPCHWSVIGSLVCGWGQHDGVCIQGCIPWFYRRRLADVARD